MKIEMSRPKESGKSTLRMIRSNTFSLPVFACKEESSAKKTIQQKNNMVVKGFESLFRYIWKTYYTIKIN